jgi:hypothetical protein
MRIPAIVCVYLCLSLPGNVLANTCVAGGPPHYSIESGVAYYTSYGGLKTAIINADAAIFKVVLLPPHVLGVCER